MLPSVVAVLLVLAGLAPEPIQPVPVKGVRDKCLPESWDYVASMKKVAARFRGTEGVVLHVGGSMTIASPFGDWARNGKGKTAEDEAILRWMHTGAKDKTDGWWLCRTEIIHYRAYTAESGLTSAMLLNGGKRELPPLAKLLTEYQPRMVTLEVGIYDVEEKRPLKEYQHHMARALDLILEQGAIPILNTIPPFKADMERTRSFNQALRALAKERGVPVLDLEQEILRRRPDDWFGTLMDRIHLTARQTGGHTTAEPTPENLRKSGYQLRGWLTVQKVAEVKRRVLDGARPEDPTSAVHPRRFGLPGGVGQTRGWYVWRKFDPETWQAEVSHEGTGATYTVRVLPWLTTYRHLAYGAHPDELLPGERVNLFFNPDDKQQRAYLVHFQDELCQMKGHNHAWQIESVAEDGRGFRARVMAGAKAFDEQVAAFTLDPTCQAWRGGKVVETVRPIRGERVYLTWVYDDKQRVVKLLSDAASLDALQAEARKRVKARVARDGMTAFIEEVAEGKARVLVFATWWAQAGELKPGQELHLQATDAAYRPSGEAVAVRLVARKNLGTYGSGCTELLGEGLDAARADAVRRWGGDKVVRVLTP